MTEFENSVSNKAGLPPGTLVYIGKKSKSKPSISVMDYNAQDFKEIKVKKSDKLIDYKESENVTWINIDGISDTEMIAQIGVDFEIHPLIQEDILNTKLRPTIEDHEKCLFISMKMLGLSKDQKTINSEQISFILGKKWLISFQERKGDVFDGLRQRIEAGKGTIRGRKVDFLLYRLIDTVVDHYFYVTEHINEKIDKLEETVIKDDTNNFVYEVQKLKKKIINLRRVITPVREILMFVKKDQNLFFDSQTQVYLDDVYEHVIQLIDILETQKEALTSILELHTSLLGQKMNQIMKVLTIMATIFIPLTFVAGIYGMNFQYMPELQWKYGYFVVWGIMLSIFLVMLYFFRKRNWL